MATRILNTIVQHMSFYFDCIHCHMTNSDFTDPDQITDGILCDNCGQPNHFGDHNRQFPS